MMFYTIDTDEPALKGKLIYHVQDHSFDFEPESLVTLQQRVGFVGTTSLLINSMQLEVGIETGILLYVWGYYPRYHWKQAKLSPPSPCVGMIRAGLESPFEEGISISIEPMIQWTTHYDSSSGWICIGDSTIPPTHEPIEFATFVIAVIEKTNLHALWLHPAFE